MTVSPTVEFVEVFTGEPAPRRQEGRATLRAPGFALELEVLPEPGWLAELIVETARLSTC